MIAPQAQGEGKGQTDTPGQTTNDQPQQQPTATPPNKYQQALLTKHNPRYQCLVLYGLQLGPQGMHYYLNHKHQSLRHIKHLNLGETRLGRSGVEPLCMLQLPDLLHINIGGNGIGSGGFVHVCMYGNWPNVQYVNLQRNMVVDGLSAMEHCNWRNLKSLVLNYNKISINQIANNMAKLERVEAIATGASDEGASDEGAVQQNAQNTSIVKREIKLSFQCRDFLAIDLLGWCTVTYGVRGE